MGPPLAEKRAQLIHPPKSNFLKMEAAALIYLKTAAWPLLGRKISSATTAVFFYRRAALLCIYIASTNPISQR